MSCRVVYWSASNIVGGIQPTAKTTRECLVARAERKQDELDAERARHVSHHQITVVLKIRHWPCLNGTFMDLVYLVVLYTMLQK